MRTGKRILAGLLCAAAFGAGAPAAAEGDVLRAEAERLRALEASTRDFAVGVAAHRRGDLDLAIHAYGLALEKDEGFVEGIVNLARALVAQGLLDEAEQWLDRAARTRDDYYALYKVRAVLALRRGQPALAVEDLGRALLLAPGDAEALTNLGVALLSQGRTAEASEVLAEAERADPNRAETALNLGLVRDRARDFGRARYHYERFLALSSAADPQREAVRARLAEIAGRREPAVGAEPPSAQAPSNPQPRPSPEEIRNANTD